MQLKCSLMNSLEKFYIPSSERYIGKKTLYSKEGRGLDFALDEIG